MKKIIIIFFSVFTVLFFKNNILANSLNNSIDETSMHYEKAIITKVFEFTDEDVFGNKEQKVEVEFLSGDKKGQKIIVINSNSSQLQTNMDLKKGQKVLLLESEDSFGELEYNISDYLRTDYIYILIGFFIILLLVVGGKKGFLSVISLFTTLVVILFGALPMIVKGYNPLLVSVISSIFITITTILIVTGFSKKSLSAILGTCFGTILSASIAYYVGIKINLTGLSLDETQLLFYLPNGLELNPRELLFAGIIWGSLGAVMDVGMSISSSVYELSSTNDSLSFKNLLKSGMNVGKDIMATMSNTLILAYLGSALPLILMMMIFNESNYKIINLDVIATEIVRSLSGSIGLIFTIPLTAILASWLMKKNWF